MSWEYIVLIAIVAVLVIMVPIYYKFFQADRSIIPEGNHFLKKQLLKVDNNTNYVCVFNVNVKVGSAYKKIPALILTDKGIYVCFLKIGEASNENVDLFKKIKSLLEKKLERDVEVLILEKAKISVDLAGASIPYTSIKGYSSKKIIRIIKGFDDALGVSHNISIKTKKDILTRIGKLGK